MVQDAFEKLMEQKPTGLYGLEGWLKNAIKSRCRTEYRNDTNRRGHLQRYKEENPSHSSPKHSLDEEKLCQVVDANLKPTNAKIIHLTSEGYKNPEIAEEIGLTERQVRNRKTESKKKLKKIIKRDQYC